MRAPNIIGPFIGLTKPDGSAHERTKMIQGRGMMYHYKSWSCAFRCPTCNRVRRANLNFLGHNGRIVCIGTKTQIERN